MVCNWHTRLTQGFLTSKNNNLYEQLTSYTIKLYVNEISNWAALTHHINWTQHAGQKPE